MNCDKYQTHLDVKMDQLHNNYIYPLSFPNSNSVNIWIGLQEVARDQEKYVKSGYE